MVIRAAVVLAALFVQGHSLRWVPKEGDQIKFRTVGEFSTSGVDAKVTAINVHKVLRVDPDGSFLVQITPVEGEAEMGGNKFPMKGTASLTNFGPKGEIKEIRNDSKAATGYRMANLTSFHAPTKNVTVGDTWTSEGKADAATGAVAWKADYKVVGEETIGAFPAYKIDVVAKETEGSDAAKANGSFWVGKDGILVRSALEWTNMKVPGAPGPVNGKLTATRLE